MRPTQLAHGAHYSPEDVAILAVAYETICDAAHLREGPQIARDLVASAVLEMATTGQRDPLRIMDGAMKKLGLRIHYAA